VTRTAPTGATFSGITDTTFTDTERPNGSLHTYVVRAKNQLSTSSASNTVNATPVAPPPTPTGLKTWPANNRVAFAWSNAGNTSSFTVYRSTTAIGGPFGTTFGGISAASGSPLFIDTTATNGTTYYYTVAGVNAAGEGAMATAVGPVAPTNGVSDKFTIESFTYASTNNTNGQDVACSTADRSCKAVDTDSGTPTTAWSADSSQSSPWIQITSGNWQTTWFVDNIRIWYDIPSGGTCGSLKIDLGYRYYNFFYDFMIVACNASGLQMLDLPVNLPIWGVSVMNANGTGLRVYDVQALGY
jgi:hypothetical protein